MGDQPLSCSSRQKSLGTTALEFKVTIILTPHLVPPALVFRTPKGYRYPRLRTPALEEHRVARQPKAGGKNFFNFLLN